MRQQQILGFTLSYCHLLSWPVSHQKPSDQIRLDDLGYLILLNCICLQLSTSTTIFFPPHIYFWISFLIIYQQRDQQRAFHSCQGNSNWIWFLFCLFLGAFSKKRFKACILVIKLQVICNSIEVSFCNDFSLCILLLSNFKKGIH